MDRAELEDKLCLLLPTKAEIFESRLEEEETKRALGRLRAAMMAGSRRPDELAACCYVAGEICSACSSTDHRHLAGVFYAMAVSFHGQAASVAALNAAAIMYLKYDRPFETWLAAGLASLAEATEMEEDKAVMLGASLRKRRDFYGRSRELTFGERRCYQLKLSFETKSLAELSLPPLSEVTLPELREFYAFFKDDGVPSTLTAEDRARLAIYIFWGEFHLVGFEVGLASALERMNELALVEESLLEFRSAYELMDRSESPVPDAEDEPFGSDGPEEEVIGGGPIIDPCFPPERPVRPTAWQGPPRRLRFEYTYRIEPQYTLEWDAQSGLLAFSSSVHGVASAQLVVGEDKWHEFWKLLQQAKVWEWQDNYELAFEDGYQWSLELEQGALTLNSQGSNANPGDETAKAPFRLLLRALETLSRYAVPMTHDLPDH